MNDVQSKYFIYCFCYGWLKQLKIKIDMDVLFNANNTDLFKTVVMSQVESKSKKEENKRVAEQFGTVITKIKTFPTNNCWIILDKHTKELLHKDLKNENEINELCSKYNYIR